MKTKLTLTVSDRIIRIAKHQSKKTGKSLSRMFEELFEPDERTSVKTEFQVAAERLLNRLEKSKPLRTRNDKALLRSFLTRKYA